MIAKSPRGVEDATFVVVCSIPLSGITLSPRKMK